MNKPLFLAASRYVNVMARHLLTEHCLNPHLHQSQGMECSDTGHQVTLVKANEGQHRRHRNTLEILLPTTPSSSCHFSVMTDFHKRFPPYCKGTADHLAEKEEAESKHSNCLMLQHCQQEKMKLYSILGHVLPKGFLHITDGH